METQRLKSRQPCCGSQERTSRGKSSKAQGAKWQNVNCREPGLRSQEQSDQGAGAAPGGDLEGNLEGCLACAWRAI